MACDIEYFKNIIREYEAMLPNLTEELNLYKLEYENLKRDLQGMDKENKLLAMRLEELMRLQQSGDAPKSFTEAHYVENLKSQLDLSNQEKQSVSDLWNKSMKRIDYLETELRVYSMETTSENNLHPTNDAMFKMKKSYDKQIKKLQNEIQISNEKLEEAVKLSQMTLESKKREMEKLLQKQDMALDTVKKMEDEMDDLRNKYSEMQTLKGAMEGAIQCKNKIISDLKIESYEAKMKVAEACHVIEVALVEKDSALKKEHEAAEKVAQLTNMLQVIVKETEEKVKNEVNLVKQEYRKKLTKFEFELKRSNDELEMRTMDLEKHATICKEMEGKIAEIRATNKQFENSTSSEKAILSNKIEELYHKLLLSEKKNIQLTKEKDSLNEIMDQQSANHEVAINNKELEKKLLEAKIRNLQNELELSNSKLVQVAIRVEELNEKVSLMDMQFQQEFDLKTAQSEQMISERISEIESINSQLNNDLRCQLESQIALNRKWKQEVRLVTDRLETRILDMRKEASDMKLRKKNLEERLADTEVKCAQYKHTLKNLCVEFHDMADMLDN